jgi:bifunctional non-homologous end joining protein LigD
LIGYHTVMLRPIGFIEPCLPTHARIVPDGPQWAYEIKHDGFRFVCWRAGDRVRVFSRQALDWTDRVPLIAGTLAALQVKSIVIDGEGVVCRSDGVSDFDMLRTDCRKAILYAFDLLELDGTDLRREPWETRRAKLASLLRNTREGVRLSEHIDCTEGERVFHHACRMGLEGIVAKRSDRPYRSGRCADWIKVKNQAHPSIARAELIVLAKRRQARKMMKSVRSP